MLLSGNFAREETEAERKSCAQLLRLGWNELIATVRGRTNITSSSSESLVLSVGGRTPASYFDMTHKHA